MIKRTSSLWLAGATVFVVSLAGCSSSGTAGNRSETSASQAGLSPSLIVTTTSSAAPSTTHAAVPRTTHASTPATTKAAPHTSATSHPHTTAAPPPPRTTTTRHTTPAPVGCHPLTNSGNCYEPGEYCRNTDHGVVGVAGDGKTIKCEYNNGWRWEPI